MPLVNQQKLSTNTNRVRKRLERLTAKAVTDYVMIEEGDRVMVCLSGGKDSYTLLDTLECVAGESAHSL